MKKKGLFWHSSLLLKIRKYNINYAKSLYLTINTTSSNFKFDLNELLKAINIDEIFLGLPDPKLTNYNITDPYVNHKNVYRYPDNLKRKIIEQNYKHYKKSNQNINQSPYYYTKRISNLVIEKLKKKGYEISKQEINENKQINQLKRLIIKKYNLNYKNVNNLIDDILSEAFDDKYSYYNYSNDTRSINSNWKKMFNQVYNKLSKIAISNNKILNVGVGNGDEALELFQDCKNITFVDIAPNGLNQIKQNFPDSKTIISRAENLSILPNDSYDLYVSLRTYNSSFFDIGSAVSEAYRVLKNDAKIVISIANGFLCPKKNTVIPGLIIPGTEFVDIYRSIDIIKQISIVFLKVGFRNINLFTTNEEIYLSAVAKKAL